MTRACPSRVADAKTQEPTKSEERREGERPPRQTPLVARPLFGPVMVRRTLAVVATHGRRIWLPLRED